MKLRKYLQRPPAPRGFFWRLRARLAIAAIIAYQKHLSPRKGFACAHRIRHGGASCSEFVRRAIEQHGLRGAVPLAREIWRVQSGGAGDAVGARAKRWQPGRQEEAAAG